MIICDPPSSSSDGDKRTSALKSYKDLLQKMNTVLAPGGKLVIFLNTPSGGVLRNLISLSRIRCLNSNLTLSFCARLSLGQDCPTLKGFPEGSYLKGLVLEKQ